MMRIAITVLFPVLWLLSSCSGTVKPDNLYGRWDYIGVKNADPEESVTADELNIEKPAILFLKDSSLVIEWGGKTLSHGTFRMDGRMIRYTEYLEGGLKREFPFLIKKLTEDELVFSTMERDFTEVTARRRN